MCIWPFLLLLLRLLVLLLLLLLCNIWIETMSNFTWALRSWKVVKVKKSPHLLCSRRWLLKSTTLPHMTKKDFTMLLFTCDKARYTPSKFPFLASKKLSKELIPHPPPSINQNKMFLTGTLVTLLSLLQDPELLPTLRQPTVLRIAWSQGKTFSDLLSPNSTFSAIPLPYPWFFPALSTPLWKGKSLFLPSS